MTINYRGKELHAINQPCIVDEEYCVVRALDADGNVYNVYWLLIGEKDDDPSEWCEWELPLNAFLQVGEPL